MVHLQRLVAGLDDIDAALLQRDVRLAVGHSPNSQTNFPGCLVIALLRAQSFILDKTDRSAVAAIVVVHVHSARKEVEAPCVL